MTFDKSEFRNRYLELAFPNDETRRDIAVKAAEAVDGVIRNALGRLTTRQIVAIFDGMTDVQLERTRQVTREMGHDVDALLAEVKKHMDEE